MRNIKLLILLSAVLALCVSCAGWPWNKRLPKPPEALETVKLYAVLVPEDVFNRIEQDNLSYEAASEFWHHNPSMTIYFKEACYKKDKEDPVPPDDAVKIQPEGAKYPVYVTGLKMRRYEDKGVILVCGEGWFYYGKALVEIAPTAMAVNDKAVDVPDLTVHQRDVLDSAEDKYENVPNVGDITIASDGRWWESVQNASP